MFEIDTEQLSFLFLLMLACYASWRKGKLIGYHTGIEVTLEKLKSSGILEYEFLDDNYSGMARNIKFRIPDD